MADDKVPNHVRIYKVTHVASGRVYIGITIKDEHARWRQHCDHAMSGRLNTPLHVAIRQYGAEAFTVEHAASAMTRYDAGMAEKTLIAQFDCVTPKGFNGTHGGEPHTRWSDESRAKASATHKGRKWTPEKRAQMAIVQASPEYREKMRAATAKRKPRKLTDEEKDKLRSAALRQHADPAARAANSARAKERMADPERRAALSAKAKEKWADAEYRAKHAQAMADIIADPEYRAKTQEGNIRRMKNPDLRLHLSETMKKNFENPAFRERYDASRNTPKLAKQRRVMSKMNREYGRLVPFPEDWEV